jgi:threonine-phosphate decarboxylase
MSERVPLHGGQLSQIAERFGVPASKLFDFSANINPEGPPESVLSCLRISLDDLSTLTNYPDLREIELRKSLARYAGVQPEHVIVANGFVQILDAVLQTLPIRRCLLPVPAFVEYRRALERASIEVVSTPLACDLNFSYGALDLKAGSYDAVLLANPQNPSGVLADHKMLVLLLEEAASQNVFVLLDEAFIDYCPEASLTTRINRFPNLIVFRSVTKFFGMPGLRVAYAAANANIRKQLQDVIAPWSITTLASLAASTAVQDKAYKQRTIALNLNRRSRLQTAIEELGIEAYPSAANFLLLRMSDAVDCENLWERLIQEHQIVLRNCANYEALSNQHLRAAVRKDAENERLVEALALVVGNKSDTYGVRAHSKL